MNTVFRYLAGHGLFAALCLTLLASGLATGCASTQTTLPMAQAPEQFQQYKVQSADHWDTVANEVVDRVRKTQEDRPDLITLPIYIAPPNDGIFVRAFASFLRSRMVTKGMQVAEYPEADALILNYNVQIVSHDSSRGDLGIGVAALGMAVVGTFTGGHTTPSDHEIIINTTLVHRNRYAMSLSQVCYINDADWELYLDPSMLRRQTETADALWRRYAVRPLAFGGYTGPQPVSPTPDEAARNLRVPAPLYSSPPMQGHSSFTAGGFSGRVTPIVEEYQMRPGGRMIDPNAPPTPLGRRR